MSDWLANGLILLAGMAIGATSIGGVLVVPALSGLAGMPLAQAVAAASLAFLPTGVMGWLSARRHAAPGACAWPLNVAALAGAVAGAAFAHAMPAGPARIGLALLAAGAGLFGLVPASATASARPMPGRTAQIALGLAVGFLSAASGTGGPVLLLPLLMLWRAPTIAAISAAMAIQLPVAAAASATHLLAGELPAALGVQISVTLLAGAWAGRCLARRWPPRVLRVIASLCLIGVAGWYGLSFRSP